MSSVIPAIQLHDLDIPALLDVVHYAPTLKDGKPPRPLNKFMVMRSVVSTYSNQKNLCFGGRDLCSLTSTIWTAVKADPLLLDMILEKTAELKAVHDILFPHYKFQPDSNKKKGKGKKRARDVEDDGKDNTEKVATGRQKRSRTRRAAPEARGGSSSVRSTPGLSTFSDFGGSSCSEAQTPPPVGSSIASTSNTVLQAPTEFAYQKSVSTDCGLTAEEWQSVWASVNPREPTSWDDLLPLPEDAFYYGY